MREKFEDRKLTGDIKIKLPGGAYWETRKEIVCENIEAVVDDLFHDQNYNITLRQLFYQLVTKNQAPNADKVYKKLGRIKDDLCYSGVLDWDAFEDRGSTLHTLV